MVGALDFGSSDAGLSPDWGHCVVFLCHLLLSNSKCNAADTPVMDWHPIQDGEGGGILLVCSCYGTWDKLWSDGPLGTYANFTTQNTVL